MRRETVGDDNHDSRSAGDGLGGELQPPAKGGEVTAPGSPHRLTNWVPSPSQPNMDLLLLSGIRESNL